MPSSAKRISFSNYIFFVDENVYEPAEDSFLFADNLEVESGDSVLDVGTGCGILGIIAAERARNVVAVDVNPYALRCAKKNAMLNNVHGKMVFVQGDLFTWLSETTAFDVILFNAPYLPVEPSEVNSWIERAWAGGITGRQIIDRFISEFPRHLKRTGRALLMQSTLASVDETVQELAECHLNAKVVADHAFPFFESVVLIEARI